ncbi:hypothetical protein ABW21_db0207086 [Orbilia brochopaga]|nr:hypothetical protein ABW21_db0207086 [Drechslerella brochopaga]
MTTDPPALDHNASAGEVPAAIGHEQGGLQLPGVRGEDSKGCDDENSTTDLEIAKLAPLKSTLTPSSFRQLEHQRSHELQQQVSQGAEQYERDLSFRPVERVDLKVRNLSLTVAPSRDLLSILLSRPDAQVARILDGIDADMPSGQLTALIGASGSGKFMFI